MSKTSDVKYSSTKSYDVKESVCTHWNSAAIALPIRSLPTRIHAWDYPLATANDGILRVPAWQEFTELARSRLNAMRRGESRAWNLSARHKSSFRAMFLSIGAWMYRQARRVVFWLPDHRSHTSIPCESLCRISTWDATRGTSDRKCVVAAPNRRCDLRLVDAWGCRLG